MISTKVNEHKDRLETFINEMKEIDGEFKALVTYTGNGKDFDLPATVEYVVTYYDCNKVMIAKRGEELTTCHNIKDVINQITAMMKLGYKPELCSIPDDYFIDNRNSAVIFSRRIVIGNDKSFTFI